MQVQSHAGPAFAIGELGRHEEGGPDSEVRPLIYCPAPQTEGAEAGWGLSEFWGGWGGAVEASHLGRPRCLRQPWSHESLFIQNQMCVKNLISVRAHPAGRTETH